MPVNHELTNVIKGTWGILGMFVGATLLALGYQIFMGWVANRPVGEGSATQGDPPAAN